jgi:alkanesulfonate monooxygenase SsuD/methylene tetrahydromethanopterin reductase-like flavin-dependent oxidoreductase (luciferase family)
MRATAPPAPFQFAVQAFSAGSAREWTELARRVEGLGYAAPHLADSSLGPGPRLERADHPPQTLAAVPSMAAALAAATRLRAG